MVQKQQNLIRLAKPNIKTTDTEKALEVLLSGNLVEGKYVNKFENDFAKFTKIPNVTLVSSATAGLHLILKALKIKKGDNVIVPSFTFPATANVVENLDADVIFCDVDKETYVVTPEEIERIIVSNNDGNLKAIIVVHEFGHPARIQEISNIAKKYNLALIEDAACALGTISDNHHVGYYSDGAVFSFHPRKAITSGEGGAIVSQNKELIEHIRILKNHGQIRGNNGIDFIEAGLNYRLTDFQAALLIGQLKRFKNEVIRRKSLADLYIRELENCPSIHFPMNDKNHSWQSFMIVLDGKINRSEVIAYLLKNKIQSNLGAQSLPSLSYYNKKYSLVESNYPNSTLLFKQGLVLPLYGKLKKENILKVTKTLQAAIDIQLK